MTTVHHGKVRGLMACAAMIAGGLAFASPATYNDLGDQSGTETEFWNNASHPLVQIDSSAAVLDFDLDTCCKTEAWNLFEIFTGAPGFLLFLM